MLGRGIDQILPHPADPRLYEAYVASARDYVDLAERVNGSIAKPVDYCYVWGDALRELQHAGPQARIVNLETSATSSRNYAHKGINYKMNPQNLPCLRAMNIDCCVLANNHVLDWGYVGLLQTLESLEQAGIGSAGAGRNATQAAAPSIIEVSGRGRVVVFAFGSASSGIPLEWAAGDDKPGVNLLGDMSAPVVAHIAERARAVRLPADILVASIHWGANWGYDIPREHAQFAHDLIDKAGFDLIHGHSSHHAKAIEIYRGKLVLYGCGDFVNDYEGIAGYEAFRGDLALMYLAKISLSDGKLVECELVPFQIRKFRLNRAAQQDRAWVRDTLDRESARFDTRVLLTAAGTLKIPRQ